MKPTLIQMKKRILIAQNSSIIRIKTIMSALLVRNLFMKRTTKRIINGQVRFIKQMFVQPVLIETNVFYQTKKQSIDEFAANTVKSTLNGCWKRAKQIKLNICKN